MLHFIALGFGTLGAVAESRHGLITKHYQSPPIATCGRQEN